MSKKQPKLKFEEEKERTATRSPPKKSKVEQSVPQKQKLKQDADKAAEKAQHLRFGKAEITPDEASRMTKQQKRAMYAAAAARSAVHREIDQYEDDNVGMQALSEGEKAAETAHDISKSRYARKLKKKARMQGKKGAKTAKSSPQKPTAAQDAGASCTGEGGSNWLSRWRQKQDIRQSYYAAAHSSTIASLAILLFINSWNEYMWPVLVVNGMETAPIQIGLQSFMGSDTNLWGSLMAATTISCIPIFVLYLFMQRRIVDSFMKWGIK